MSYSYDPDGQRTAMHDGTGNSSYGYDSLHDLVSSTNGSGATIGYGYDLRGDLTSLTYPGNLTVTRNYDPAGRLSGVADWLGHTTSFTPNADGLLISESYPNGTTASLGYDSADRLTGIADAKGGVGFASFSYGRDAAGLITSSTPAGVTEAPTTYAYTALNQLKSANSDHYLYDPADNPTELKTSSTLNYDPANQPLSMFTAAGVTTFVYDARGDRVDANPPLGTTTAYGYDQANRLNLSKRTCLGLVPLRRRRAARIQDGDRHDDALRLGCRQPASAPAR